MSQSPPNYMERVPVKISEKYKPPPIISLPHSILHRLKADDSNWSQLEYDFSLERNVLSKIEQWKKVRETEKENRCERLRRCELERAREIEENQKQLLTAVSYPSTEELSSDDESSFSPSKATGYVENETTVMGTPVVAQFSPSQQRFDTILMPTVVPETYYNKTKINSVKTNNASKINYSDFENDTSSPFDNVELKTINDLDILAQVLNVTQIHSKEDDSATVAIEQCDDNGKSLNENVADPCINGNDIAQPIVSPYSPQSFLQNARNFSYEQTVSQNLSNIREDVNGKNNEFCYYNNLPNNQSYNGYVCGNYTNNLEGNNSNLQNYHRTLLNQINYGNHSTLDVHTSYSEPTIVNSARNKSKSVPDILKELNDEINDSEIRRSKNIGQILENNEENCDIVTRTTSRTEQHNPDSFLKLSPSLQRLVNNISLMGFPLERVSKIAAKLGNDDKKIFEHLIPLSELLDLGFEESKISEALLRFDNNKEKALDFLIS